MAFELAGARLLMPGFGMGIEVWAAVIATTLGFLAVGYAVGGRVADAWPRPSTLAVVLMLSGISLLAVRWFGSRVSELYSDLSFVVAAWCAAVSILSVPLLSLGMVQPILMRLMIRSTDQSGSVVGGLLAIGTVGGVVGTGVTALVLMPRIGVSQTLLVLGAGNALVGIVTFAAYRSWRSAGCALVASVAVSAATWQPAPASAPDGPFRVIDRVEGLYGRIEVLEYRGMRAIASNGIIQTAIPTSHPVTMPGTLIQGREYIELIPYFRPQAATALLIGLGAGQHARCLAAYGIRTQCVEIEPAMADLAAKHFGLTAEVTVADGRAFLDRAARKYDVVVLDAFLGGTVPEHLYTQEAFRQIADRLGPRGILAVHLIGRPEHPATRAIAGTLGKVFSNMIAAKSGLGNDLQHLYLFVSCDSLILHPEQRVQLDLLGFTGHEFFDIVIDDAPVLTDDRSCLGLLSRDLVAEHRRRSKQLERGPSW